LIFNLAKIQQSLFDLNEEYGKVSVCLTGGAHKERSLEEHLASGHLFWPLFQVWFGPGLQMMGELIQPRFNASAF
jgi:hypothetical protein